MLETKKEIVYTVMLEILALDNRKRVGIDVGSDEGGKWICFSVIIS